MGCLHRPCFLGAAFKKKGIFFSGSVLVPTSRSARPTWRLHDRHKQKYGSLKLQGSD